MSIVHGTADRLSPVIAAEDLKRRVPSARLIAVPDGGHMLPNTHAALLRDDHVVGVGRDQFGHATRQQENGLGVTVGELAVVGAEAAIELLHGGVAP